MIHHKIGYCLKFSSQSKQHGSVTRSTGVGRLTCRQMSASFLLFVRFCSFASVRQFRHADTWGCCQHGKEHVLLPMERQGFLWLPRYCLIFRPQRSCLSGMISVSTASRTSNPRHASDRHRLVVVKPNSYLSNSSLAASGTLWSRFVSQWFVSEYFSTFPQPHSEKGNRQTTGDRVVYRTAENNL